MALAPGSEAGKEEGGLDSYMSSFQGTIRRNFRYHIFGEGINYDE